MPPCREADEDRWANDEHDMGQTERDLADELLAIQDARWQRGERPPIADLVREYGSPVSSETILDLIDNELVLRESHGETIDLLAMIAQFPELAREIRIQYELHSLFDVVDSLDSIARQSSSAVETVRIGDGAPTETPVDSIHRDVPIPKAEQPWEGESVPSVVGGCSLIRILGTGEWGPFMKGSIPYFSGLLPSKSSGRLWPDRTRSVRDFSGKPGPLHHCSTTTSPPCTGPARIRGCCSSSCPVWRAKLWRTA